jgi:NADPH2:quinone reductase
MALELGAEACFDYSEDWPDQVRDHAGRGVDVAYDSIGSTFLQSLDCLRNRGTLVAFGTAGGNPPTVDPQLLMERSLAIVGGDLWSYLDSRQARIDHARRLFEAIARRTLKIPRIEQFSLEQGAEAHQRMEDRSFFGKIVLTSDE